MTAPTAAPDPLVPIECDLRDFQYMPLDVVRLRDSGFASKATDAEFRAGVLLWCAAWHQVPAASLPDDDVELSNLAGFGRVVREWKKLRNGALRGWVKCSDGRLYHPIVAEKAAEAWDAKLFQRFKTDCARIRKADERNKTKTSIDDFVTWKANGCRMRHHEPVAVDNTGKSQGQPRDNGSNGREGIGNREGKGIEKGKPSDVPEPTGSGAASAPQAVDKIFAFGVPLLTTAGVTERNARSMLGLMRKKHGDDAVAAVLDLCAKERPIEPVAWLQEALKVETGTTKANGMNRGPDWWASNEGIDRKAREIGMAARPSESYPDFKQRIFDRIRTDNGRST